MLYCLPLRFAVVAHRLRHSPNRRVATVLHTFGLIGLTTHCTGGVALLGARFAVPRRVIPFCAPRLHIRSRYFNGSHFLRSALPRPVSRDPNHLKILIT